MEQELIDRYEDLMESDQSDAEVQYQLGLCYLRGIGVEQDAQAAERWLRRAADQDHAEAAALLRRAEEQPQEQLSPITEETLPEWCERAEDGDAEAQYQVAKYLSEQNVDVSTELESYLSAAVEQGHPMACLLLARQVWDSDPKRAAELLANASDCGITEAMQKLAECYAQGRGVQQDLQKAERWFVQAAEVSGPQEMLRLALRYEMGDGIAKNLVKSKAWLSRAKKAGAENAEEALVRLREDRSSELFEKGKEKYDNEDYTAAVKWFQQAAELGHADAMDWLGVCYHNGTGVEQDQAAAEQWFLQAAKTGDARMKAILAARYATGTCLQQSDSGSKAWLARAMAEDKERAQEEFDFQCKAWNDQKAARREALFYSGKEKYNSRAYAEAVQLFQQAAELGHADAMDWLGACYHDGSGVERDQSTAEQWFLRAGETGDAQMKALLAARYATGTGFQQSDSDSQIWLDRAVAEDREQAMETFDSLCRHWKEEQAAQRKAEEEQRRAEEEQRKAQQAAQREALFNNGKEKYNSRAYTEAAKLFQQAAELDHAEAMDWLGICYHDGTGVKQNQSAAEQWFLRAGETGGAREKAILAARYATGTCLQQSDSDSKLWLDRAMDEDKELAQEEFDTQYRHWNEQKEAQRKAEEEQRRAEREQKEKKQRDQKRFLIFAIVALLLPWVYNLLCRFRMGGNLLTLLICCSGPALAAFSNHKGHHELCIAAFLSQAVALFWGVATYLDWYDFFPALFHVVIADVVSFFLVSLLSAIFKDEKK